MSSIPIHCFHFSLLLFFFWPRNQPHLQALVLKRQLKGFTQFKHNPGVQLGEKARQYFLCNCSLLHRQQKALNLQTASLNKVLKLMLRQWSDFQFPVSEKKDLSRQVQVLHKPALFFSSFFIFFNLLSMPLRSVMPYWKAIFSYSVGGALLRISHTSTSGSWLTWTMLRSDSKRELLLMAHLDR